MEVNVTRKALLGVLFMLIPMLTKAQETDSTVVRYAHILDSISAKYQHARSTRDYSVRLTPYYLPIITAGTLYSRPLQMMLGVEGKESLYHGDSQLLVLGSLSKALSNIYVNRPDLITVTEQQLLNAGFFREEITKPLVDETKMSDKAVDSALEDDDDVPVNFVFTRPNFWTFKGDLSLQFTQSHFSENWYQGGEDNYSGISMVTLEANFDNKKKIQWENKLELQLGFQTAKSDTCHVFKATNNLMRATTKLGYQAAKNWFYTAQVQAYTQLYPNYNTNTNKVNSDFASPLTTVVSVGMDYKLKLKRFNMSVYVAPVAYNMKFVDRKNLRKRNGMEDEDQKIKHTLGPNVTINHTLTLGKNFNWVSRLYWFSSDLKATNIEWENTLTFTFNRFISTKLFVYPKIDDSSPSRKSEKGSYFMLKEWLSLGLSYRF